MELFYNELYDFLNSEKEINELDLTLIPTLGCCNNCSYCFNKKVVELKTAKESEQDFMNSLDYLSSKFHLNRFVVYGGEPTLKYNLLNKIYEKYNNISFEIFTSGKFLKRLNPDLIKNATINIGMENPKYFFQRLNKSNSHSFDKDLIENIQYTTSLNNHVIFTTPMCEDLGAKSFMNCIKEYDKLFGEKYVLMWTRIDACGIKDVFSNLDNISIENYRKYIDKLPGYMYIKYMLESRVNNTTSMKHNVRIPLLMPDGTIEYSSMYTRYDAKTDKIYLNSKNVSAKNYHPLKNRMHILSLQFEDIVRFMENNCKTCPNRLYCPKKYNIYTENNKDCTLKPHVLHYYKYFKKAFPEIAKRNEEENKIFRSLSC